MKHLNKQPVCYILNFRKDDEIYGYIGQSISFNRRLSKHLTLLKNNRHPNIKLQAVYNDGFTYDENPIIILAESRDHARLLEDGLIRANIGNSWMTNINVGDDTLTHHPNREEYAARNRKNLLAYSSSLSSEEMFKLHSQPGEKNGMYGRAHSEESRKKMSDKRKDFYKHNVSPAKGTKLNPERIKQMSEFASTRTGEKNSFYGRHHSKETKEHLSRLFKGRLPANTIRVSINGIEYDGFTEAGRILGVHTTVVRHRAISKNPKFKEWKIISECPTTRT